MSHCLDSSGKLQIKIICPLYPIVEIRADSIEIPALNGIRTIIPDRAPLFCALIPGEVIVHQEGGDSTTYLISQGVCEVRDNLCSILAWGGLLNRISKEYIINQLTQAEKMFKLHTTNTIRQEVLSRVTFFKMVLQKLESKK